jgi:hypothetical protein
MRIDAFQIISMQKDFGREKCTKERLCWKVRVESESSSPNLEDKSTAGDKTHVVVRCFFLYLIITNIGQSNWFAWDCTN